MTPIHLEFPTGLTRNHFPVVAIQLPMKQKQEDKEIAFVMISQEIRRTAG